VDWINLTQKSLLL